MDSLAQWLVDNVINGGPNAFCSLLLLFLAGLVLERMRLMKVVAGKDRQIEQMVEESGKGNQALVAGLTGLMRGLVELGAETGHEHRRHHHDGSRSQGPCAAFPIDKPERRATQGKAQQTTRDRKPK